MTELDLSSLLGLGDRRAGLAGEVKLGHSEWARARLMQVRLTVERSVPELLLTYFAVGSPAPRARPDRAPPPPPPAPPQAVVHVPLGEVLTWGNEETGRLWLERAVVARFRQVLS